MASHLHTITFDALDPYAQALWWSEVLAVPMSDEDHPGDPRRIDPQAHRSQVVDHRLRSFARPAGSPPVFHSCWMTGLRAVRFFCQSFPHPSNHLAKPRFEIALLSATLEPVAHHARIHPRRTGPCETTPPELSAISPSSAGGLSPPPRASRINRIRHDIHRGQTNPGPKAPLSEAGIARGSPHDPRQRTSPRPHLRRRRPPPPLPPA